MSISDAKLLGALDVAIPSLRARLALGDKIPLVDGNDLLSSLEEARAYLEMKLGRRPHTELERLVREAQRRISEHEASKNAQAMEIARFSRQLAGEPD